MTKATNLRDRCLSHFATLGIPFRPESLDVLLTKAEKENLSHLDFLHQLIGEQANARRERSIQWRIREALDGNRVEWVRRYRLSQQGIATADAENEPDSFR